MRNKSLPDTKSESALAELRLQAEKRLSQRQAETPFREDDIRRQHHELQVHQIELEMQIEGLTESEARFREFFEKNSSVMLVVDPSTGLIVEANKAALAFYGYAPRPLVGVSISDIVIVPTSQTAQPLGQTSKGEDGRFQLRHRLASGEVRDVEVYTTSIERGESVLCISIVHDVTANKDVLTALKRSEAWFRSIFENANTGIATTDNTGRLTSFNEAFRTLLGYESEQLLGMGLAEFTHADDLKTEIPLFDAVLAGKRDHYHLTKRYIANGGKVRWVDLFATAIRGPSNEISYFFGIVNDITRHKRAEEHLRIAAVAFESQQSMMVTDANKVIVRVNQAFIECTGYTAEEVVGQTPSLLKSGLHDSGFYRKMWATIRRTGQWQGEVWDKRKNGELYPKWLTISAVKDVDGSVTNYVGAHYDMTDRKAAEEKIEALAFFDQLTGLPNRTLLLDRLKQAKVTSERGAEFCALLFVDLDNFKAINDALGHDVGDMLLKEAARRLVASVRAGDTVARLGGDEFVLILTNLGPREAEAANRAEMVVEKILASLNQVYELDNGAHHNTASIGITLFKGTLTPLDILMRQGDLTMYKAKSAGRNTFRFFDPAMEVAVRERASLESDLRHALKEGQLSLYYQAQIADVRRLTGAEVLLRWKHPRRGMVPPSEFIPLAEETGLILPIGRWVLATACTQLALWAKQSGMASLTIAVNVSMKQFRQPDFVQEVLDVLAETGANPHLLKLELTESLMVDNVEEIIEKMFALKAKGIRFSLDDFGTGYSSLAYLKRLPLDQLKIDQSFVRDILIDPNDAAIAETIVTLARSLWLGVIAEGVETEAQRDFLAQVGCHAYQGYFFSRPLPIDEFEKFAQSSRALV